MDIYFFSKKNKCQMFFRSSYELVAFKKLEKDKNVLKYEYETEKVFYTFDNKKHFTIPDILVTYKDKNKRLIEIKPWQHLKRKRVKVKIQAMREYASQFNWKFSIWTEKELGI